MRANTKLDGLCVKVGKILGVNLFIDYGDIYPKYLSLCQRFDGGGYAVQNFAYGLKTSEMQSFLDGALFVLTHKK